MTVVWLAVLVVVILMALDVLRKLRTREFTDQDFERGAQRPSLMRTGLQEFQGFLEPEKKVAVEVVKQKKRKTDQTVPGDPPDTTR